LKRATRKKRKKEIAKKDDRARKKGEGTVKIYRSKKN